MTLYIGVDFHPHQQTASWCDTATGETDSVDLLHNFEAVRKFYESFTEPAIIGIEASTRAAWFENMLSETKHTLLVGNPVLISQSRQLRKRLAQNFYSRAKLEFFCILFVHSWQNTTNQPRMHE